MSILSSMLAYNSDVFTTAMTQKKPDSFYVTGGVNLFFERYLGRVKCFVCDVRVEIQQHTNSIPHSKDIYTLYMMERTPLQRMSKMTKEKYM